MKREKKHARSRNKLAELLGIDAPEEKPTGPSARRVRNDASREAEAVLGYIRNPGSYDERACRRCKGLFMSDRANVALCSDTCRAAELADIGITWDWNKEPDQRWYYAFEGDTRTNEPLVVGVQATAILKSESFVLPSSPVPVESNSIDLDDDFLYNF